MMKFTTRSLQLALGAMALSLAGMASAQTNEAPAPDKAPAKQVHRKPHKGHHERHEHMARGSSSTKEAAAARQAQREGRLGGGTEDQYQRNALARSGVFKAEMDKQACVERIRNGQASGSVEGGGMIMEYTQQVPLSR